jgi:hypothetical protein
VTDRVRQGESWKWDGRTTSCPAGQVPAAAQPAVCPELGNLVPDLQDKPCNGYALKHLRKQHESHHRQCITRWQGLQMNQLSYTAYGSHACAQQSH